MSAEQMQICNLPTRIDIRNRHKPNICPVRLADPVSEVGQTRNARCEPSGSDQLRSEDCEPGAPNYKRLKVTGNEAFQISPV